MIIEGLLLFFSVESEALYITSSKRTCDMAVAMALIRCKLFCHFAALSPSRDANLSSLRVLSQGRSGPNCSSPRLSRCY